MKKIYKSRPRKYNPVRICNPQDMHTARLYPRQGLKLVIDKPNSLSNVSDDAEFEIKVGGGCLALDGVSENRKGQLVYDFVQKYDLTNWSEVSETFLGEVRIDLVNNTHEKKDECGYVGSTIGVYHVPHYGCDKVLTVVNPEAGMVKLEPHRTLEVVCFEPDWDEDRLDASGGEEWKAHIEDLEGNDNGIFVEEIKRNWFVTRLQGNDRTKTGDFYVLPRYCPNVNPLLEERDRATYAAELGRKHKPKREYHFWFAFTQDSIKKISALKSGNYVVARIKLSGKAKARNNQTTLTAEREFILMLTKHGKPVAVHGKGKPKGSSMFNRTTALACTTQNSATKREFDKNRSLLTNPGTTEQLDFCTGFEDCIVEIASPKAYWPDEPTDSVWNLLPDLNASAKADEHLDIVPLEPIEKFGTRYQRFKVGRKSDKTGNSTGFLGAIKVFYPPKAHLHEASKRISVWMNYKTTTGIYKGGCTSYSNRCGPIHWKNGLGQYERPMLAIIKLEEIACKSLSDGANTKKLSEVSIYSAEDWEGYYYGVPFKKKETYKTDCPQGASTTGSSSTTGIGTTYTTTGTTSGSTIEPVILYNPTHCQEVNLRPDQELIIRLMPPEDVLTRQDEREKCRGELWTVNPMAVADVRPIIVRNRVTPLGTDRYRQEIVVKTDSHRLPQHKGNHGMGMIALECSATSRVVRLRVNKDIQTDKPYRLPQNLVFLTDNPSHKANDRNYFLIQNWRHGNALRVNPTDLFYVSHPEVKSAEWANCDWTVQFTQRPIPPELWEKMSGDVRGAVDRQRPWYSKDCPAFMQKTLMFKALDQCGNSAKLLEELKKLVKGDHFPMATVAFTAENYDEIEGEGGLVETCVRLKHELHLCVALDRPKAKFLPIYYPVDNATVTAEVGTTLSFHLPKAREDAVSYYIWNLSSYPVFLDDLGYTKLGDDDNHKLRIKFAGEGDICFKAGKKTKTIRVIAKESGK